MHRIPWRNLVRKAGSIFPALSAGNAFHRKQFPDGWGKGHQIWTTRILCFPPYNMSVFIKWLSKWDKMRQALQEEFWWGGNSIKTSNLWWKWTSHQNFPLFHLPWGRELIKITFYPFPTAFSTLCNLTRIKRTGTKGRDVFRSKEKGRRIRKLSSDSPGHYLLFFPSWRL